MIYKKFFSILLFISFYIISGDIFQQQFGRLLFILKKNIPAGVLDKAGIK